MKKWFAVMLFTALICSAIIGTAAGTTYYYDGEYHAYEGNIFKLKVNGKLLEPEMPPIVFEDYSVVPARAVFQDGLGATVEWDGENQRVTVRLDDQTLIMTINKTMAGLNGRWVTMPIAPKIINGHTMVPVRYVGEKMGMVVDFDSQTDTVIINNKKTDKKPETSQKPAIAPVQVKKVTHQVSETELMLTVTTDTEKAPYSAFVLSEPLRLVVDVTGGEFERLPSVIEVEEGNITGVRFGQNENARIVVDLTENLGYKVTTSGKQLYISVTLDPERAPAIKDVLKLITYGYEGGRDYIRFEDLEKGTPVKSGSTITVPIFGERLPMESEEKKVTGFFAAKMTYTPISETEGTVTIHLKSAEADMYEQGEEIRLKSIHKALKRSVMIDAGHGGADAGAVAYNEDGTIKAKEKDFNLDVALRAQKLLEAQGVEVHMIRNEDVYVDFLRVGSIANDAGTSLFVSIHTNSFTAEQANGIETFGYLQAGSVSNGMTSERLSQIMLEELLEETGAYSRGVKDGKELAVINSTKMPATLIEIGFISNPEECEKMMQEAYRQKLAQAVCDGVLKAFEEMAI
ncbi:MAG: N-acetylmuramoyl-L-alanine amidase [Clostridia bacterium]|nr:N-acetylmuramoyl-L-alanine amidase [Clostridia bacterium]